MSISVNVQMACRNPRLATKKLVERWALEVLTAHQGRHQITVRVVDEPEGAALNEQFRHKAGATNVLSFPLEEPPGLRDVRFGDIAVCAPVVAREASDQGKSREAHFAHMVVHGTLHLLGYDHNDKQEAERMESEEVRILARLGYADPYEPQPTP